jgi:hypothetical protein
MVAEGIAESLRKGICFLLDRQLPSGEFGTMRWKKPKVEAALYVKSVFVTSFVLHSLREMVNFTQVKEISQQAIKFLLSEMEQNGLWRFFGKNSHIHFDVDDTCCILASLKEWGVRMNYYSKASLLLKYRNNQGLFYTWILDVDPPFEKEDNNIDRVVNGNALFFYSLLDRPIPEVEHYLIQVVETGEFLQRSPYYDSPFTFIYCLTRAYADGCNSTLGSAVTGIKDYLLQAKERNKPHGDPLEGALATVGLLNCGGKNTELTQEIEHLLSMQGKDGGWPMGIFFTGGPYTEYRIAYGSRELTTAITLEAVSKYLKASK